MSFVRERERGLIIELLRGAITEDAFYLAFPIKPGDGSQAGQVMLMRALQERDAIAVEFGLYLGHRFGVSAEYLDVLIGLAGASWHERHEDVIDALAKLKAPTSVEAIFRTAVARLPYRAYDEFNSLGDKCVRALGAIGTKEAVVRLGDLLASGDPTLERGAQSQLQRLERGGGPEEVRAIARETLAVPRGGAKQ